MILVARKVVEQLAEHQKLVSESREVVAGRTMPGYRSYIAAAEAQVQAEVEDSDHSAASAEAIGS